MEQDNKGRTAEEYNNKSSDNVWLWEKGME